MSHHELFLLLGKGWRFEGRWGGLPYKLWSITIFWSRKTQSILGLCKEQKIQSQKYVEVDEEKDPRVVVCCVGHWGKTILKKNEVQRFQDKRTKPKSWPLC